MEKSKEVKKEKHQHKNQINLEFMQTWFAAENFLPISLFPKSQDHHALLLSIIHLDFLSTRFKQELHNSDNKIQKFIGKMRIANMITIL